MHQHRWNSADVRDAGGSGFPFGRVKFVRMDARGPELQPPRRQRGLARAEVP